MNRRASRLLCSLAAIACVTTGSLSTTLTSAHASQLTAANSAIDPNAVFALQTSNQGSALAPANDPTGKGETGNDVPVILDQSDGPYTGRTEQMWRFIPQQGSGQVQNTYGPSGPVAAPGGVTNAYEVQNVKSDKCLSVYYNGTAVGTRLVQYDCHAWPDQLFALNRVPANSYGIVGYQLQSLSSGLWLGGPSAYQQPAVPMTLDTTDNALAFYPKQIFSVVPSGKYRLTTANSLVLDVAPGADDAPAVQSPVRLWQDQSWSFARQADGSYEVVNSRSGQCLSIFYGSTAAGAGLVQYTCHGWTDQTWDLVPVRDPVIGYSLMLTSRLTGMAVDVPGDTIIQGAQFDQWPVTAGINQRFVVTQG